MIQFFYFPEANDSSSPANKDSHSTNESPFPNDPGTKNHRLPDGGGPADGFINEEGEDSGKGFLNHVYRNNNAAPSHPDDNHEPKQ